MNEHEQAAALGGTIGTIVALVAPVLIGYLAARRLSRRRDGYDPVRWPIAVGFVVSLLMLLGTCSQRDGINRGGAAAASSAVGGADDAAVKVFDGPADRPLPVPMTRDGLTASKAILDSAVTSRLPSSIDRRQLSSTIAQTAIAGRTILIYRLVYPGVSEDLQYIGVADGRRKVVECIASVGSVGERCRRQANAIFGGGAAAGAARG